MRWVLLLLLGGCTLVDQNTFNPQAGAAPVIPPAPAPPAVIAGTPPLVVIGAGDFTAALRQAVAAARSRKPGVVFDVVEVAPPDAAGEGLGSRAAAVAQAIVGEGIPATRVRLVARPEAGAAAEQVRVYVH